jgi:hypothetical protein
MRTRTHTKVWSESFCSDSKVTLLHLTQKPSTRWRYSRFCSHLLLQVSGLPQWCHSGFQPTLILICYWFQSCRVHHREVKSTPPTHPHKPPQEVWDCGWMGKLQMWICDITRPWQHVGCPTVVSLESTWGVPQWCHWQTLFWWRSVQHMAYSRILGARGSLCILLLEE